MKALRLQSPLLGVLGLVALGLVAMKLVQGDLVVAVVLLLTERLLLPVARSLVMSGRPPQE